MLHLIQAALILQVHRDSPVHLQAVRLIQLTKRPKM